MNSAIGANCVSCRCDLARPSARHAGHRARRCGRVVAPRGAQGYADANLRASHAVQALGRRCWPARRGRRRMYLSGKAELTALARSAGAARDAPPAGLSRADVERLHHARDLALANLGSARPAGSGAAGRRQCQQAHHRLSQAVRSERVCLRARAAHGPGACAAGRGQPDGVRGAYACGYTDSHFTKAFLRRGVAQQLLPRG